MTNEIPTSHYDSIGLEYGLYRIPDPRIARQIRTAIGSARTVCNIGAGTGSYEPTDLEVTPIEPSIKMIEQRADPSRVIRAQAENLPIADGQFDVAMAVLTVHHWSAPLQGLAEMRRVSRRQVILTFDPGRVESFWLVRDYFPEFAVLDQQRALPLETFEAVLRPCKISTVWVPWDCTDGFLAAYWRRPEMYLNPAVRRAISSFSLLPPETVTHRLTKLEADIASGAWHQTNSTLLEKKEMDFGYRLIATEDTIVMATHV